MKIEKLFASDLRFKGYFLKREYKHLLLYPSINYSIYLPTHKKEKKSSLYIMTHAFGFSSLNIINISLLMKPST